jgi:hypothetical protein
MSSGTKKIFLISTVVTVFAILLLLLWYDDQKRAIPF